MEIGKQIRSRREEVKMTQQQLADQIYVTRQTISKWELGKSEPDPISRSSLERILAVQLTEGSSSQKAEEADVMKKFSGSQVCCCLGFYFYRCVFCG